MRPARYIFLNKGLGMSAGKAAAQAAHAEMLAMNDLWETSLDYCHGADDRLDWFENQDALYHEWYGSGHYTKLVMEADCAERLHWIKQYLEARGYRTYLVIDEGRTEIDPFSPTALAVELVDKDEERVGQHFGEFRTYKDRKPKEPPKKKGLFK